MAVEMPKLDEGSADWVDDVPQIENGMPPTGGAVDLPNDQGVANAQAQVLGKRSLWLKAQVDALLALVEGQNFVTPADLQQAIDDLISGAPGALDTLAELASALSDNDGEIAALLAAIAGKLAKDQNLADLGDSDAALSNLGVSSFGKALLASTDAAAAKNALGITKPFTLITSLNPTGVAVTSAMWASGYDSIRLVGTEIVVDDGVDLRMRFSMNGAFVDSANYGWVIDGTSNGNQRTFSNDNETFGQLHHSVDPIGGVTSEERGVHFDLRVMRPDTLGHSLVRGRVDYRNSSGAQTLLDFNSTLKILGAVDGIQFFPQSGLFSGGNIIVIGEKFT